MPALATKSERGLTVEQRAALDARGRSVSLAAGAGCGKTFVLTERFLAEVDPRVVGDDAAELTELVAITFTDAAAREMRDRIRRRAAERLASAADDREAAAWRRLLRSIDAARISTIHSFATALLRRYAVEAGVDPQFTVLDAPAANLLRLQTVDDFLRRELIAGNGDALDLAAAGSLEELRLDLARVSEAKSRDAILRWRDKSVDEVAAAWREHHERIIVPKELSQLLASPALAELTSICTSGIARSDRLRERFAALAAELAAFHPGVEVSADALARVRALALVGNNFRKQDDWHNADDRATFCDACKRIRDLIDKKSPKPLDEAACRSAAAEGLALVRLAAGVVDLIEAAKARRGQLEFDDLLLKSHALLTDPRQDAIRRDVAAGARLVMVDEFQDTNPLQLAIVRAVCGDDWRERGLFAVGDFKQSIYGFQGAEPTVSTELRAALPQESRLSLTTNFRSQPGVLAFVNAIFHDEFAEYELLVPHRPQSTLGPCVEFLWTETKPANGCDSGDGDELDADDGASDAPAAAAADPDADDKSAAACRRREARRIARRLRQLLDEQAEIVVHDSGGEPTPRPVEPGDIAILFRALSDVQAYEEALRDAGLDYYLAGGHAFYAQQEVFDVLNLLRAVASTVDEIALAGALRSPFFSLRDETLFWMVEEHGSLNAALDAVGLAERIGGEERGKVERAAATIARLRQAKDRLLVADLLSLALELTGFDAVTSTEFLGPRKAANLAKLVEQARALDADSPGDLHGYVTQLAEFVARTPKEPPAAAQAEGNVIRLMTIHNAKGLEFPVVVVADLERRNPPGASDAVIHEELGPLVPRSESNKEKAKGACVGFDFYKNDEAEREAAERTRLFYVACTRAADYLILSSAIDDVRAPKRDWLRLVDRHVRLADGGLAAPLPPGYAVPQVRVVVDEPAIADLDASVRRPDLARLVAKTRELARTLRPLPASATPIPVDAAARVRFSFSQLSGRLAAVDANDPSQGENSQLDQPATPVQPLRNRDHGAWQRGALIHTLLERIDWRQPGDMRELARRLATDLVDDDPNQFAADAAETVSRFAASDRARQLAEAKSLDRELEFLLPWPPGRPGENGAAGRYVQGYIDCLYQDAEGRWRILDFKTNRVGADRVRQVAAQYELQMLCYTIAAEEALGVELAESTLVLLGAGVEHRYTWLSDDRAAGVGRLTAAMDADVAAALTAPGR